MAVRCPICKKSEDAVFQLKYHCIKVHGSDFVTCPGCTLPHTDLKTLIKHTKRCPAFGRNGAPKGDNDTATFVDNVKCTICHFSAITHEEAVHHFESQHLHYRYICTSAYGAHKCRQYFTRHSDLIEHRTRYHESANCKLNESLPPVMLAIRSGKIQSKSSTRALGKKKKLDPSLKRSPIIFKNATVKQKRGFMKFFNQLLCIDCNQNFPNPNEIADHFEKEHQVRVWLCTVCKRGFATEGGHRAHRERIECEENPKYSRRTRSRGKAEGVNPNMECSSSDDACNETTSDSENSQ